MSLKAEALLKLKQAWIFLYLRMFGENAIFHMQLSFILTSASSVKQKSVVFLFPVEPDFVQGH